MINSHNIAQRAIQTSVKKLFDPSCPISSRGGQCQNFLGNLLPLRIFQGMAVLTTCPPSGSAYDYTCTVIIFLQVRSSTVIKHNLSDIGFPIERSIYYCASQAWISNSCQQTIINKITTLEHLAAWTDKLASIDVLATNIKENDGSHSRYRYHQ